MEDQDADLPYVPRSSRSPSILSTFLTSGVRSEVDLDFDEVTQESVPETSSNISGRSRIFARRPLSHYNPAPPFPHYGASSSISSDIGIYSRRTEPLEAPPISSNSSTGIIRNTNFYRPLSASSRSWLLSELRLREEDIFWMHHLKIVVGLSCIAGFLMGLWCFLIIESSQRTTAVSPRIGYDNVNYLDMGMTCGKRNSDVESGSRRSASNLNNKSAALSLSGDEYFISGEPQIPFDYALFPLGARVLSTGRTKPLSTFDAKLFGFTIYQEKDGETMEESPLLPFVIPGRCWRFQDFPGTLIIQLAEPIIITSFSLSHVSSANMPIDRLNSAPRHFEVRALLNENDEDGIVLGSYEYNLASGRPTQFFPVQFQIDHPVHIVELRILDNHGSLDFTCVYRFKVFGTP